MQIKKGNYCVLKIAVKDANGVLLTDLATATAVKCMIKENASDADSAAIVSKSLSSGIVVNTPSTGYIQITINATDIASTIEPGEKYIGVQIEYSATKIIEIDLKDNNQSTNKITIVEDVIR